MVKMILTIKRRKGMSHDEFVRYQREVHRPLQLALPEFHRYVRRFVVSYPTAAPNYSGPDYDCLVEAWFDSMDDLDGYYLAESRKATVEPDHENFMDMTAFGRIVAEEDIIVG